jgi:hypothetical protein
MSGAPATVWCRSTARTLLMVWVAATWSACLGTGCGAPADAGSRADARGVLRQADSTCPTSPATPLTGLIDDFDDRDLILPVGSGLSGTWSATTYWGDPLRLSVAADPSESTSRALRLDGSGPGGMGPGALVSVSLADGCPINAQPYTGIRVKARLSGSFRLNLPSLDTMATSNGGPCEPQGPDRTCDHFGMAIRGLGTRLEEYEIPFSRLSQLQAGPPAELKLSELLGVELLATPAQPYDVWLDEIAFAHLDDCAGSVAFEDELIDDFEDGDLVNRGMPHGQTLAFTGASLNLEKSLCKDCLSVEPDPDGARGQLLRVHQAETFEMVMGSLAAGCRSTDATAYDGVELKVRAAGQFTVVLASLDGAINEQPFTGQGQWRTVRVPFGAKVDRSQLDFVDIQQPFDSSLHRDDMLVDDLKFYNGEAPLGARCKSAADCAGADCLRPSSSVTGLAGPAGGICSRPCTDAQDCNDLRAGSVCALELGYCLETCQLNDPASAVLDPDKCHGREDMACTVGDVGPSAGGEGGVSGLEPATLCRPRCSVDAQCGGDFYCNPTTGLCQAARPTGLTQGEPCDPEDPHPVTACAGYCDPASSTCRRLCTLAAPQGCAAGSETSNGDLACLPLFGDSGPGDEGMCAIPCDCSDQCGQGETCAAVTLAVPLEHAGVCAAEGSQATTLANCPNGCASGQVRACHGPGGCLGAQHCVADGSGYGACACAAAPASAGAPADEPGPSRNGGEGGEASSSLGGQPVVGSETVRSLSQGCGCAIPIRSGAGREGALLLLLGLAFGGRSRVRRCAEPAAAIWPCTYSTRAHSVRGWRAVSFSRQKGKPS